MPSVAVTGAVSVGPVPEGARLLLTQRSSRLVDILKVLLCYSNNFMAERIGESLGGPAAIQDQLSKLLALSPDQIKLSSSWFGCKSDLSARNDEDLQGLRTELQKNGLSPSDILPVAGVDPGTLQERFTGPSWRQRYRETGTLVRTDGGASALLGNYEQPTARCFSS